MNAELKSKWVAALRSGDYAQTQGVLINRYENSFWILSKKISLLTPPK